MTKKKTTYFGKNLVAVATNRHIVKNFARPTKFFLYLSLKTQLAYNEVLFADFPGLFDKGIVVILKPSRATFYENRVFSKRT